MGREVWLPDTLNGGMNSLFDFRERRAHDWDRHMSGQKWVIFDADNTLWDLEYLYNEARKEFCKYTLNLLNEAGQNPHGDVTADFVEQSQRHRDIQLQKTYGYSSSRFARSFEDTLMFFFQHAPPQAVIHVRAIAQTVFEKPVRVVEGLEVILERLSKKFSLAIVTAGERWVQEMRIRQFHLRDSFKEIIVVERKSAAIFQEFCEKHYAKAEDCWVVGDSIRSDVLPARTAGLKAIHVKAANWAAEHADLPEGTPTVDALNDILQILL
jgi:putative hydrolase of the HAD superfamily